MRNVQHLLFSLLISLSGIHCLAGVVEKTYYFPAPSVSPKGDYQIINFPGTLLSATPGDPMVPYYPVILVLPPGEEAVSVEWAGSGEVVYPGPVELYPAQQVRPVSEGDSVRFLRNEQTYRMTTPYPTLQTGTLTTQHLHGYAIAMTTFTPVSYVPATGKLTWYSEITIRIITQPGRRSTEALTHFNDTPPAATQVAAFSQNPEAMELYRQTASTLPGDTPPGILPGAPADDYQLLIISPVLFQNEFQGLTDMYATKGITSQVTTTATISSTVPGWDLAEKVRNYIISEYQFHHIIYVLLAGNPVHVPYRGFYCQVQSSSVYTDSNIPADLYFSGVDGTYDANGNHIYGEVNDDPDLLPELSVGRFPVNDTAELRNMIHKSIAYQTNPVLDEFARPLLAGEYLWANPLTMGGDFMDLLVDDHADSGYFTHGIPSATNEIAKLYDTVIPPGGGIWQWSAVTLRAMINQGTSFIHHLGHANYNYMLRMSVSDITNANFSMVNGTDHNYTFLYTQGCITGAFDYSTCIAAKAVSIDNFLAGGVFNSRYGWFNEGSSDGPSQHLEREFVSAMYTDTLPDRHLGSAHRISKVKTSPWIFAPGQWEPGALRWCFYCCNVLGDPALEVWTEEPSVFGSLTWNGSSDSTWENPGNWTPARIPTSLDDVTIPHTPVQPVVTTQTAACHDLTIQDEGTLTIPSGKKLTAWGHVTLQGSENP